MELGLRKQDLAFQAEVCGFIDRHWPERVRGVRGNSADDHRDRTPHVQAWFDALVAQRWSVPNWPLEHGGAGWTPTQKFIWDRETARAETPQMSVFGVAMLGPVLCRWGSQAQQSKFLAPIREARVAWCYGHSEPGAGADLAGLGTAAVRKGDHYIVNAVRTYSSGGPLRNRRAADWMFFLIRTCSGSSPSEGISLLLVDMQSPGIQVAPVATFGSQYSAERVSLTDVRVPAGHRVGEEGQGWTYARALLDDEAAGVAGLATSRKQLERVSQIAARTPCDGGKVADDTAFQRKYRELDVDLRGLEMLELRMLADVEARQAPGSEPSILQMILKVRSTEISQRIADLMVETLGYYALPYPDELPIDNEGSIGHDYALPAVQGWLFAHASSIYDGSSEDQKNVIARSALGL